MSVIASESLLSPLNHAAGGEAFVAPLPSIADGESDASSEIEPLESLTTAELFARLAPPEWLLAGMWRQRQAAVILGPSRCLKTSLAVELCAALASGGKFLGEFAAEREFRVGFVGGEEALVAVGQWQQRCGGGAERELAALDRIVWAFNLVGPGGEVNLRRLGDWITRQELEVVLIDVADLASKTRRGEAAQLQALVRCCLDAGATPIVCCQTRKELNPRVMNAADLASAPCGAVARQWLLVNRREAFVLGSGLHQLWLTYGGSGGQSGLWGIDIEEGAEDETADGRWEVTLRDIASIEREAAESQAVYLRWKLRGVMTQIEPADATKLKIRKMSGMSGGKFGVTWDQLVAAGEIVLASPGSQGKEPRYRLVDPEEKNARGFVHSPAADDAGAAAESPLPKKIARPSPPDLEKSTPASPPGVIDQCVLSLRTGKIYATHEEAILDKPPPSPVPSARNGPRRRVKRKKKRR